MDAIIEEALAVDDNNLREFALRIRNREDEYRSERQNQLWDLGAMTRRVKHPPLRMSDIVTLVEAAPDEEAQLQTVLARLAKRGEWAELAIATVGPQDTDALVNFLESLAVKEMEHSKTAHGKSLVKCVACEEELQPKDLVTTTCGHCYCGECLKLVFNAAISDESLYPPSCCAQTKIPIEHAKRFLDRKLERTFEEKGVEFSTVDRTYCSDPTCSTFIPPDEIRSATVYCWNCDKATCVVCKAPGHEGDCPIDHELAALLKYAEEMRWQRCYDCLSVVQRRDGCNHMECRCGAAFCYTCGRELSLDENSRCPCQNFDPPPYNFYRRPADRSQPPDSPRTIQEDDWGEDPATDWDPTNWNFPEEDGGNPVQQEQDISRAATPDVPQFVAPQPINLAWDNGIPWEAVAPQAVNLAWDAEATWNLDSGEQASIVDSRPRTPDIETVQDVTPPDADATLLPVTSNADLVNLLRQLVAVVTAQYPVLLNQDQENEAPVSTGPAVTRSTPASDHLSLGSDASFQHSRSHTSGEDALGQERVSDVQLSDRHNSGELAQSNHNTEDTPEHKDLGNFSSTSKQSTRQSRLRTKLSPRRLLRVLRKAGMSALRGKGHTSPCSNQTTFE